jgi:hypothetical protein
MLALGCYWCIKAYENWLEQPVVTTIKNPGLKVEEVKINTTGEPRAFFHPKFHLFSKKIVNKECIILKHRLTILP